MYTAVEIASIDAKTHEISMSSRLPMIAGNMPPSDPRGMPAGLDKINSQVIALNPFFKI
ncbi:hypothetical protein SDC9_184689 [bioreactor metagenome]|uniref:Uncharacterized protein n=1 Tax=bioreactor metagenome TaxID=1076179 RepID=A0A645HNZ6_9ZZZZ